MTTNSNISTTLYVHVYIGTNTIDHEILCIYDNDSQLYI